MANLIAMCVDPETSALRLDWDNDRHQAFRMKGRDPESVKQFFEEIMWCVEMEKRAGEI